MYLQAIFAATIEKLKMSYDSPSQTSDERINTAQCNASRRIEKVIATVQGVSFDFNGHGCQIVSTACRVSRSSQSRASTKSSCAWIRGPYAPLKMMPSSENRAMLGLYGAMVSTRLSPSPRRSPDRGRGRLRSTAGWKPSTTASIRVGMVPSTPPTGSRRETAPSGPRSIRLPSGAARRPDQRAGLHRAGYLRGRSDHHAG